MMDIKPIETSYKEYLFRSRLEARWAVFFDEMGLSYRYEMEGFQLANVRYLPDFWLPEGIHFLNEKESRKDVWVEIKPTTELSEFERKKIAEFVKQTGYSILLIAGEPDVNVNIRLISYKEQERKWVVTDANWVELGDHSLGLIQLQSLEGSEESNVNQAVKRLAQTQRLISAYTTAKQARFDRSDILRTGSSQSTTKTCDVCGTTFVADQSYHRLCYSCYKDNRQVNSPSNNPPAISLSNSGKGAELSDGKLPWRINQRTSWVGVGLISLVILLVMLATYSLRDNANTAEKISPSTLNASSPLPTNSSATQQRNSANSSQSNSEPQDLQSRAVLIEESPCDCTENLYNCGDFESSASAQACYDYCMPIAGDIHFLDRDNDKKVCELNP